MTIVSVHRSNSRLILPENTLPEPVRILGLSERNGAISGVFAYPKEVIMSIRAWDDALEGITHHGTPYSIFETEKFARMMLRQSVLAFETIVGANIGSAKELPELEWSVTEALVDRLVDASKGALNPQRSLVLAAAAAGLTVGTASTDADFLGNVLGETLSLTSPEDALEQSEALRNRAMREKNVLPTHPSGYDSLDDWVVRSRLGITD